MHSLSSRRATDRLVFRNESPISPQALFVELEAEDGTVHAPEIYPRPDGTTYVCGLPGEAALPANPSDVAPDCPSIAWPRDWRHNHETGWEKQRRRFL